MNRISQFLAKAGKRLLLLAGSLLVALVLIEIILRVIGYSPAVSSPLTSFHQADERLGWIGVPNYSSRFKTLKFDASVETNEEGFREVTSDVVPQEQAPEVWIFGDSTIWGWGVSNGELFADVLQSEVGPSLRIQNFGINAYGTVQEFLLLEQLLEEKEAPAKVIVMVCGNDFADNLTEQGGARPYLRRADSAADFELANLPVSRKIGGPVATMGRKSYACSFLYYCSSLFKQLRKRGKYEEMFASSWDQVAVPPKGEDPGRLGEEQVEAMRFALQKIAGLCERHKIELNVISFPQATTPYIKTAHSFAIEEICSDLPATAVEIESGMVENRQDYYIGAGDFHWNAAGNRKAAEVLVERLGPRLGL